MDWTKRALYGGTKLQIPDVYSKLSNEAQIELQDLVTDFLGRKGYSLDDFEFEVILAVTAYKEIEESETSKKYKPENE